MKYSIIFSLYLLTGLFLLTGCQEETIGCRSASRSRRNNRVDSQICISERCKQYDSPLGR